MGIQSSVHEPRLIPRHELERDSDLYLLQLGP